MVKIRVGGSRQNQFEALPGGHAKKIGPTDDNVINRLNGQMISMPTHIPDVKQVILSINNWWTNLKTTFFKIKYTPDSCDDNTNHRQLCKEILEKTSVSYPDIYATLQEEFKLQSSSSTDNLIQASNKLHVYTLIEQRQSIAEIVWNSLLADANSLEIIEKAFDEQKNKYGTEAFRNTKMLRSLTEFSKTKYEEFIQKNIASLHKLLPKNTNVELLGMGFGGVAFRVKYKPYTEFVLKFGLTQKISDENIGNLERDIDELRKLERKDLIHSSFSQRLAYLQTGDLTMEYLVPEALEGTILATRLSSGVNLLKLAENQWQNFREGKNPGNYEKAFFEYGISDENIYHLALYHQKLCNYGINFYDLFPHNIIYDFAQRYQSSPTKSQRSETLEIDKQGESDWSAKTKLVYDGVFRFIDSVTRAIPGSIEDSITKARQEYPLDSLVFDLVTFLVLYEQSHPYTVSIRRAARSYFNQTTHGRNEEKEYKAFKQKRFNQIQSVLEKLVRYDPSKKQALQEALERLVKHFSNKNKHPANAFHKDFSRITKEGVDYIKQLNNHFTANSSKA